MPQSIDGKIELIGLNREAFRYLVPRHSTGDSDIRLDPRKLRSGFYEKKRILQRTIREISVDGVRYSVRSAPKPAIQRAFLYAEQQAYRHF